MKYLALLALWATPAAAYGTALQIHIGSLSVNEGQVATVPITKTGGNGRLIIVNWTTTDGTAHSGTDFVSRSGSVSVGSSPVNIPVATINNQAVSGARSFTVRARVTSGTVHPSASGTVTITDVADTPPAPPPAPSTPGYVDSPTLAGGTPIASEFASITTIYPSYQPNPQPPDEPVGAFRFICSAGQLLYDDPLVYPGQPGLSHLHQFYGNLGANANSTANSLRTTGRTTCGDPLANPANRSGYWVAAMLDGNGNVVQPDYAQLYYKRNPKSSAVCQPGNQYGITSCVTIPNGIRFIFGYNMATGTAAQYPWRWNCDATGIEDTNMVIPLATCPVGSVLFARQQAPVCWDGVHLDSPDHRSHVAYMQNTNLGYFACPAGYPVGIAGLSLAFAYRIAPGDNTALWHLSSDVMHPELPRGSTMHADYFEAWDPTVKAMWTDNCIDRMLNCVGGALGNGYSIHGAETPYYVINGVSTPLWQNPNHLVPVPVHP